MSWHEAQERYGSDKPDVRFGMELVELTQVFADTGFNAFKAPCVKGIRVPGGAELSRKRLDQVKCPVTLLVGDMGQRWFRKSAEALAKMLPDVRLETIAGTILTEHERPERTIHGGRRPRAARGAARRVGADPVGEPARQRGCGRGAHRFPPV
jgi:aspartyl-tRNA synthetase